MSHKALSLAIADYDRVAALADGRVRLEGVDVLPDASGRRVRRQRDVAVSFRITRQQGRDWTAVPVFQYRTGCHVGVYIREDSDITTPAAGRLRRTRKARRSRGRRSSSSCPTSGAGGYDIYARLLAPYLEKCLDAIVVVKNEPGAGGLLATSKFFWLGRVSAEPNVLVVASDSEVRRSMTCASQPSRSGSSRPGPAATST